MVHTIAGLVGCQRGDVSNDLLRLLVEARRVSMRSEGKDPGNKSCEYLERSPPDELQGLEVMD